MRDDEIDYRMMYPRGGYHSRPKPKSRKRVRQQEIVEPEAEPEVQPETKEEREFRKEAERKGRLDWLDDETGMVFERWKEKRSRR